MKFKVGDKVRVRQWKAMEREYGLNEDGNINHGCIFLQNMKKYCGQVVTIKKIYYNYYLIEEDDGEFFWEDWMFEGYAFNYGDEVEVSADGEIWHKAIYVGYIDGTKEPYRVVMCHNIEKFKRGEKFYCSAYKYARPISKHKIIIDGKEIEILEEKYQALKKTLLEEES